MAAEEEQTPGRRLATLLKERRRILGWTQDDLSSHARVSRQTIIRYESGAASNPESTALRAVCLAAGLDMREVLVAMGYVTRDELEMPPAPPPLDSVLVKVNVYLSDERLTASAKDHLRDTIDSAVGFWRRQLTGKDHREPSAADRAAGRPVTNR